ncbi:MAG TPA: extradiol ring-cleavage dioxygenase [Chloroflexota bacterium]|nr:extradiol ring-cleavage dioxygenase [Chloroflexota bacterium]
MGEILGLGVTHGPFVLYPEATMANFLRRGLADQKTPRELLDPRNWPPPMQAEWGSDEGLSSAFKHRQQLVDGFRRTREILDRFNPDVVVIWGDDQYENFREDVVPAFCVYIEDEYRCKPFSRPGGLGTTENVWGVGGDWELVAKGHRAAAKELTSYLLSEEFDVAWAYQQLHFDFGHAFWRTVAHLDYDRKGFDYPIIPFHVNCYGRQFTRGKHGELDPPSPTPGRCFKLGAAVARFFQESPYRTALIGSSSWSHAFLTQKHHLLWPDVEADKARYEELRAGKLDAWKGIPLAQLEDAGEHEMLNWICLAGAMHALGRKPTTTEFVESWVSNSCKVFATFEP